MHPLESRVLAQLCQPVDVDRGRLAPGRDDDEVAVPRLELLEQREQLLALGAALRPPYTLLGLPPRQLEGLDLDLRGLPRLRPALGDAREERLGRFRRLERRLVVDRSCDGNQR